KPVSFLFSQNITTNLLEDAQILLYLDNLKRTNISIRPFEEVYGETWKDQITDIGNKMHQSHLN
ncbi:40186_t:CDS:1, partial [Gigaspora margarita]